MTYNPQSLRELGAYWTSQGGVNLGVVGDRAHRKGYHLGRGRIYGASGVGDADYSVRTARDKAGLSEAASAIDLGRLDGSLKKLYAFSVWLVGRCRVDAPGTRDIREIIYSPDGKTVYGWTREAGVASKPIAGYGDRSHITHTHISFYRDSQPRDKLPLFSPFFAQVAKPPAPKPPVPKPPAPKPPAPKPPAGKYHTVKAGDSLWRIAVRNLTTLGRIRALNPGLKDLIRPGQVIRVK
jgi:hypothetical protein